MLLLAMLVHNNGKTSLKNVNQVNKNPTQLKTQWINKWLPETFCQLDLDLREVFSFNISPCFTCCCLNSEIKALALSIMKFEHSGILACLSRAKVNIHSRLSNNWLKQSIQQSALEGKRNWVGLCIANVDDYISQSSICVCIP